MSAFFRRLLFYFRRDRFDRDLADELRFHEQMKAEELADDAAARRRIGNPLRIREQSREPWIFAAIGPGTGLPWLPAPAFGLLASATAFVAVLAARGRR